MSRFTNLEFNHESDGDLHSDSRVKDEHYYLANGQASFEKAEFEQALRDYSKVLQFNPQNPQAWTGQVRALIELGELREAKVWADKALERFPQEPELLAAKAVALARAGELDAALAFSDASIDERGDTPYIWLARGDVLLARDERRAEYCFEKALLLSPQNWVVAWLAARIRYFHRQFVSALRLVERALKWEASQYALWLQLGLCQQQLGLIEPARYALAQATELNPFGEDARRALQALAKCSWWKRLTSRWRSLPSR